MDFLAIIALVTKGISIAEGLIAAGKAAAPAFDAVKNLLHSAKGGTVTDEDLAATEKLLDSMLDDFNEPITE